MFRRFKWFIINTLMRLIDEPFKGTPDDEKRVQSWLADSWQHPGFRAYFRDRDKAFLRQLSNGAGTKEEPRDDYVRKYGQRMEMLMMSVRCKKAHLAREAKKPKT